jgi:hypothetical protein
MYFPRHQHGIEKLNEVDYQLSCHRSSNQTTSFPPFIEILANKMRIPSSSLATPLVRKFIPGQNMETQRNRIDLQNKFFLGIEATAFKDSSVDQRNKFISTFHRVIHDFVVREDMKMFSLVCME